MNHPLPDHHLPSRPVTVIGRRRRWTAGWATAVVVLLIGTFLPWLQSGRVARNSYQVAGVGSRRLTDSPVAWLFDAWPFLGPLWAVAAMLLVLKLHRTAATTSLVLALLTAVVAVAGLVLGGAVSSAAFAVAVTGPLVTLLGALAVCVTAVGLLRSPPPSQRLRSPGTFSGIN